MIIVTVSSGTNSCPRAHTFYLFSLAQTVLASFIVYYFVSSFLVPHVSFLLYKKYKDKEVSQIRHETSMNNRELWIRTQYVHGKRKKKQ